MKESPIIFNTEMVQAILEGRKTQTRRIFKDHPRLASDVSKVDLAMWFNDYDEYILSFSQYGKTGDLLWVKETFQRNFSSHVSHQGYLYKTDIGFKDVNYRIWCYEKKGEYFDHYDRQFSWKPSIHMPKAAARIWLKITDIRIERLMDISNEDAIAEGIKIVGKYRYKNYLKDLNKDFFLSPLPSFRSLFESINGEQIWKANPWVWVITFEKIEK